MSRHAEVEYAHWAAPWLPRRAALSPARLAVSGPGLRLSYRQLHQRVVRCAERLEFLGVRRGDLVAVQLESGLPDLIMVHALQLCGAVLLPLNTRQAPPESATQLRHWSVGFLLARAEDPLLPALGWPRRGGTLRVGGCDLLCLRGRAEHPPVSPCGQLATALTLLATSGSSGRPKGVVLGPENFLASAVAVQRLLGAGAADRWLLGMPLFHVAGLSIVLRSVLVGSALVLTEGLQQGFDVAAVARALRVEGITHLSLVPTMLRRLLARDAARRCPASLRCLLLGGAPADRVLLRRAVGSGYPVAPTYGLTEAASQVATCPPGQVSGQGEAGLHLLPGTALRIAPQRRGAHCGEILVRGPSVMRGYWTAAGVCQRALRQGWLATGDLGRLDSLGRLQVLGRRDEMIISGGENLHPAQIEAVLQRHPAVAEACVVGRADAEFGQRPVAFWVAEAGAAATASMLAAFCREHLAGYKVPAAFHRLAALPRSAAGKVVRRELPGG